MDCGPTSLRMIAAYYGREYSGAMLRKRCFITRQGVSMLGISEAAESIGFKTVGVRMTVNELTKRMPLPCILHWNQRHFVVLYKITRRHGKCYFHISDPATKKIVYNNEEFSRCWVATKSRGRECGTALVLEPTPDFYRHHGDNRRPHRSLSFFIRYLRPYRKEIIQLLLGMLVACVLQLVFPFLTQALVDVGIHGSSLNFIVLILIGQLMISVAQLGVEFTRSWLLLHINARINIALISDFLTKLMKLPLNYFDSKNVGDIMQRVGDHNRIEQFLMGSSISTLFSFVSFFIFAIVLFIYNPVILSIYILGNSLYVVWVAVFMKRRRELDIKRFETSANEQSNLIQLITGMQEIKLNNCERPKRWQWERIQVRLFNISVKGQALGQIQQSGSVFFSQITNLIITFIAAKCVVEGTMTLGMMVALSYIVGMLNGPINSFITFMRQFQDARISLERLNEIHNREDEETGALGTVGDLTSNHDIVMQNVWFSYGGADRNHVLKDISLRIPQGKITAIVGASGSGKTTMMKLLLGFYTPLKGKITIGNMPLSEINPRFWRANTGAVMQEGYIFSDTIANNIALDTDNIDTERLTRAVQTANLRDFIDSLPLGYNTMIGMEGNGISQGQRQRILMARVIYKNPHYIFFDEATNALDANNERIIMNNLSNFYKGKTVVIVAHRLSTVRNADNIIVMDKGSIAEEGTHDTLIATKGLYFNLIKNQIEIGNA